MSSNLAVGSIASLAWFACISLADGGAASGAFDIRALRACIKRSWRRGAVPPVEPPAVRKALMGKRGSETRRKEQSVLVRLDDSDYVRLSNLARRSGITRAEYLRRLIEGDHDREEGGGSSLLTETDRTLLAALTRSMGHLAGLMKLAMVKTPSVGSGLTIRSVLDAHRQELQELQGQIRALLGRTR
jgi:hypothetical protein